MSETNETKQQEMVEVQESTLRHRFEGAKTVSSEEEEEPKETQTTEVVGTGISSQEEKEESSDGSNEDVDAVDTPSETEMPPLKRVRKEYVEVDGIKYYPQTVVREDEFGREYVTVQEDRYYKQEESWNTPFPVTLSVSLIMGINIINIFCAFAQIYSCS
jgi:hypothetical protein